MSQLDMIDHLDGTALHGRARNWGFSAFFTAVAARWHSHADVAVAEDAGPKRRPGEKHYLADIGMAVDF